MSCWENFDRADAEIALLLVPSMGQAAKMLDPTITVLPYGSQIKIEDSRTHKFRWLVFKVKYLSVKSVIFQIQHSALSVGDSISKCDIHLLLTFKSLWQALASIEIKREEVDAVMGACRWKCQRPCLLKEMFCLHHHLFIPVSPLLH